MKPLFLLIWLESKTCEHLISTFLPRLDLKYNKYLTLMLGGKSYINDNERLTMLKLQVIDTFSCNILILQIDNCPSSSRHQSCITLARCLEHWMDGGWCSGCSTDAKQTRGRMQMVKLTYWLSNCSAIMGPCTPALCTTGRCSCSCTNKQYSSCILQINNGKDVLTFLTLVSC